MHFSFKIKQNNILKRMEKYKDAPCRQETLYLMLYKYHYILYKKVMSQVPSVASAIDRHRK